MESNCLIDAVKMVLGQRINILEKATKSIYVPHDTMLLYMGKLHGLEDALNLLNSTLKSVLVELDGRHVEQKPVEKQDYSDLNDLERAILRGFLCAGVENVPVGIIKETAKECLAQMNPAEWSEEDKRILIGIIGLIDHNQHYDVDNKEMLDWLRSLRPQSRQEWSEEDEAMRNNIIRVLSAFVGTVECESNPSLSSSYLTYMREIDWLKSLRPSWKPSEEQMDELRKVLIPGETFDCDILIGLLERLEELK